MSHTLFAVKFPWWPIGHIPVQQLHPSRDDKEGLSKQRTLPKRLPDCSAWMLGLAR